MAEQMVTALPCPFCGSLALTQVDADGTKWGAIRCGECGAQCGDVRTGYGKPETWWNDAVQEWNKRASPRVTATTPEPTPEAYLVVQDNSGHREAVALHKVGAEQVIRTIHSEYGEHYGTFSIVPLSRTSALTPDEPPRTEGSDNGMVLRTITPTEGTA